MARALGWTILASFASCAAAGPVAAFTNWAPINAAELCRLAPPPGALGLCTGHSVEWGEVEPQLAVGSNLAVPALGDVNGDGRTDLLYGEQSFSGGAPAIGELWVRLGREGGGLDEPLALLQVVEVQFASGAVGDFPGHKPRPALGDLDGDRIVDLLLVGLRGRRPMISLFLGVRGGGFREVEGGLAAHLQHLLDASAFVEVPRPTIGDWNGDGWLDLVMGDFGNSPLMVLLNQEGKRFLRSADFLLDNAIVGDVRWSWPALADLNGDGITDLAVSNRGWLSLWLGTGGGRFEPVSDHDNVLSNHSGGKGTADEAFTLGDLDGDGLVDLVWVHNTWMTVVLARRSQPFRPVTAGDPLRSVEVEPQLYGAGLAFGDLNGDGFIDLVVAEQTDWMWRVHIWLSEGGASFTKPDFVMPTQKGGWPGLALGDLDGDGVLDLVVGFADLPNSSLNVFWGDPAVVPGFRLPSQALDGFAEVMESTQTSSNPRPALHDFNEDGLPDLILVAGHQEWRHLSVWINAGSPAGTFRRASAAEARGLDIAPAFPSHAVPAVGDLDGDGLADVLVAWGDTTSSGIIVFRGLADGAFRLRQPTPGDPLSGLVLRLWPSAALGDLDGDGRVELVVSSSESTRLAVFRAGFCLHRCGRMGVCQAPAGRCECFTRAQGPLCQMCAEGFFGRDCEPCPGALEPQGICSSRGICEDEVQSAVRRALADPYGTGTCKCTSPFFTGTDCSEGACPPGYVQELYDHTSLLRTCEPCPAGRVHNTTGAVGASYCRACPPLAVANSDLTGCVCTNGSVLVEGPDDSSGLGGSCGCIEGWVREFDQATRTFVCELCPAGTRQSVAGMVGQSSCKPCPPLEHSSDDRTRCKCAGPQLVRLADGECGCAPAHVRVRDQAEASYHCQRCPEHTIQPQLGAVGLQMCLPCPTLQEPTASQLECVCARGTVDLAGGAGCSPEPCHTRGGGVTCMQPNVTLDSFVTAEGFYRLPGRRMLPVRCRVPGLCLGGPAGDACAHGTAGPECMVCAFQDWYKVSPSRGCRQCSLTAGTWLTAASVAFLLAAAVAMAPGWREEVLARLEQGRHAWDRQVAYILPKVVMTAQVFQKFNATSRMESTTNATREALARLSFLSADFWAVGHLTSCGLGVGYYGQYLLQLAALAVLVAAALGIAHVTDSSAASAFLFVFRLTHMPTITSTLRLFACDGKLQAATREAKERFGDPGPEASAYLVEDFRVECRGPRYLAFRVLGLGVLACWSLGVVCSLLGVALAKRRLLNPGLVARQVEVQSLPEEEAYRLDVHCQYREHAAAAEVAEELLLRECLAISGVRQAAFSEPLPIPGAFGLRLCRRPPDAPGAAADGAGPSPDAAAEQPLQAAAALCRKASHMDILELAKVKLRVEAEQRDSSLRVLAPLYQHYWPRAWWYGLFAMLAQVGYCILFLLPGDAQDTVSAIFAVAMLFVTGYVRPYIRRSDNFMATFHHACLAVLFIAQGEGQRARRALSVACVAAPALLLLATAAHAYVLPCRRAVWALERAQQALREEFLLRACSRGAAMRPARTEPAEVARELALATARRQRGWLTRVWWCLLRRRRVALLVAGARAPYGLEDGAAVLLPDGREGTVWYGFPGLGCYAVAAGWLVPRVVEDDGGSPRLFRADELRPVGGAEGEAAMQVQLRELRADSAAGRGEAEA